VTHNAGTKAMKTAFGKYKFYKRLGRFRTEGRASQ
jgi:hypothetical protein